MNKRALVFIKNIFSSMAVNVTKMLITLLLTLVLPKFIGEADYSYWQLYLFYFTYLAYSSIGWCEGTHLKYGGEDYEKLPASAMAGQFWTLAIYELIFNGIFSVCVFLFVRDDIKVQLLVWAAVSALLDILRYYLQIVLQATYRINLYAKIAMWERVLFLIFSLFFLLIGKRSYIFFVYAEIIARAVSLIYAVAMCKEIVFVRLPGPAEIKTETRELIKIGYKLLVATVAGQLIIGVVRFAIENQWGNLVFGKVSLALSMVNMIITFIAAVSVVVFPMLKKMEQDRLTDIYIIMREVITTSLVCVLLLYAPMKKVLTLWLPQYELSLRYLALLLPICIYETRYLVLLSTYFKTLRQERMQLKTNLVSMGLSVLGTIAVVYGFKSLEGAIILIVLLIGFKAYYSESIIAGTLKVKVDFKWEIIMIVAFITSSWFLNDWQAMGVYALCLAVYCVCRRKKITGIIQQVKVLLKG